MGYGLPIYHIDRIIRETGSDFGDESHIIYVNAQIRDETALGRLMHDFACTDPQDMYYDLLARRVHYFKADEKGVAAMCKVMEDMRTKFEMKPHGQKPLPSPAICWPSGS